VKVRCWGARGSVPVSGAQYVRYGGDTSCLEIRANDGSLLILDAGTGIRALGVQLSLQPPVPMTLLLSHFHWDHIQGLPFFRPLYNPATRLALCGSHGAQGELLRVLTQALRPPLFPVAFDQVPAQLSFLCFADESLCVNGFSIRRMPISHPNHGAGFRIDADGATLVYLTDNELGLRHKGGGGFADYVEFSRGADLLIHDAQYTPEEYHNRRGWGHSHFEDVARLAVEAGVLTLGLFHHDQERTDEAQDELLARCRSLLKTPGGPQCFALAQGWEMDLSG